MTTKLVNVRVPEQLLIEGKEVLESAGYANFQELVKDALRHTILEIKKDQALIALEQTFGSSQTKQKKQFTAETKDKIAEELARNLGKQKDILRRAGL